MRSSIFVTSVLATGVLAWPKPQLLGLDLGARVTLFQTVTVTKPAATCILATVTKPASTCLTVTVTKPAATCLTVTAGLPPVVIPVPTVGPVQQPTTSKWVLLPLTTPKPLPTLQTSWVPLPQTTSKPAVVPSSSKPVLAPSTTPVPSTGGRITGTAQAYLSIGLAYQAAILYHHNAARANHGAPPLIWDSSCEANARAAANTCTYARYVPAGVSQGQNRYLSTSDGFNVTAAITESWYKNQFSSVAPWFGIATLPVSLLASVDQLTQVLWKGTSRVGCASVDCGTRMSGGGATAASNKYTVCNYAAAGNVGGLFAINVGRPLSTTALGRWTD